MLLTVHHPSFTIVVGRLTCLRQRLVTRSAVVGGTVGEEPVDDQTTNREDEDEERPEQLVGGRTARLDNLDCAGRQRLADGAYSCDGPVMTQGYARTKDDNVKN